jgi:hypothetical protein
VARPQARRGPEPLPGAPSRPGRDPGAGPGRAPADPS